MAPEDEEDHARAYKGPEKREIIRHTSVTFAQRSTHTRCHVFETRYVRHLDSRARRRPYEKVIGRPGYNTLARDDMQSLMGLMLSDCDGLDREGGLQQHASCPACRVSARF